MICIFGIILHLIEWHVFMRHSTFRYIIVLSSQTLFSIVACNYGSTGIWTQINKTNGLIMLCNKQRLFSHIFNNLKWEKLVEFMETYLVCIFTNCKLYDWFNWFYGFKFITENLFVCNYIPRFFTVIAINLTVKENFTGQIFKGIPYQNISLFLILLR